MNLAPWNWYLEHGWRVPYDLWGETPTAEVRRRVKVLSDSARLMYQQAMNVK